MVFEIKSSTKKTKGFEKSLKPFAVLVSPTDGRNKKCYNALFMRRHNETNVLEQDIRRRE